MHGGDEGGRGHTAGEHTCICTGEHTRAAPCSSLGLHVPMQVTILWFFFTLLVTVLMLNLLIAMMATTFERIADQQKEATPYMCMHAHHHMTSSRRQCRAHAHALAQEWALQRAHFTLEAERMYSFFTRTRPPHHNCDPSGRWWLLMEDTHSSRYDYLAPPVEPDPTQPSAYSLVGGGRPAKVVRRHTTQAGEPSVRETMGASYGVDA